MIEIASKDRMISAAVTLFARSGLNGITTRDISQCANVSESNIFRYFPSKRDLFMAAVDSELGKLSVRAEVLARIANAEDPQLAFRALFELITDTVVNWPELVRLLNFSALELGSDMDPIYQRHLGPIVAACARNFATWSRDYGFHDLSAPVTVLSFVATVVMLQNFYSVFTGSALPFPSAESAAAEYAELWYRVLSVRPEADSRSSEVAMASASGR
jgi:AcrR family transcriptional regulator